MASWHARTHRVGDPLVWLCRSRGPGLDQLVLVEPCPDPIIATQMLSLVVPVYKNEDSLPRLLRELETLAASLRDTLEVVFVVDGSPEDRKSTRLNSSHD